MVKKQKLLGRIVEKGYNLSTISDAMGMSRPTFRKKLNNTIDFRVSEVAKLCILLSIGSGEVGDYFFANDVPETDTNRSEK